MTGDKRYVMKSSDWVPLVDAMRYLKHVPCCGDVASKLEEIFVAAQQGNYYFIEIGYEGQDGKCFILGTEFDPDPKHPHESHLSDVK